ncbi:MAG: PAS domain-containing sensor histidine kinase [Dorea sp.]|nr:PAS domain-containing sensor histidine kinase [Dorea sp.]
MTKRIFRSIFLTALGVFLASALLFMGVLYEYFSVVQLSQLRMQTDLAAQGAEKEGLRFFDGLDVKYYRITWIDADGTVLYDSRSNTGEMENHLEREEIKKAFSEGKGESSRYSFTLMERFNYCAQRLTDGTVLRLSITQNTVLTLLLGMLPSIGMIVGAAIVLSLVLASRLSKSIIRPFNRLNLDEPLKNEGYEELEPLLGRIAVQQRKIRRQSEELEQKRNEFEAVTTGMEEGIILLNEKQMILGMNPAAARIFHLDSSYVGKHILSVDHSLKLRELIHKAGAGSRGEMKMELGQGNYQFDAAPVYSEGLISGIVLLILDVTEKERAEQIRREFTANVSHELKTPLQTISGYAELLANGMVKPEDTAGFSARIYGESKRMIRLVEDIIRLSRLDEGAEDMERETVELYGLAEKVMESLTGEAERAEVQMTLKGEPAPVYGIYRILEGIVYNLCDNAVKYNRKGGLVSLSVYNEESGVRLTVSDTGIGIPEECRERIFERFYRVDKSRSKEKGGTGLGLSIVKHGARLHNAVIGLESSPGEGTAVSVYFPKNGALERFTKILQNPDNKFDIDSINYT